jgi:hypothetical protein
MPYNYFLTHYCHQLSTSTRNTPPLTCRKPPRLKTSPPREMSTGKRQASAGWPKLGGGPSLVRGPLTHCLG